ncbi:MAG: TonB family protein [Methylobacteriaceae bacterium]|nr:TonB family protein [Methylobacteriaceae bacterium]
MKAMRAVRPAAPLVADERLRLLPRAMVQSARQREVGVSLGAILLVHAALIAFILYRDGWDRFDVEPQQEIPVEVVAEVPPDPPKPPPQPEQKPEENYEKPAYSAPRAATETAANQAGAQDKTEAPQAQSKAQDGAPVAANDAAPAPQVTSSPLRGTADEKIADEKAEPLEAASPLPDATPGQAPARAKAEQTAETQTATQLPAKAAFPSVSFMAMTMPAALNGGDEDNRFMSNVFAKILSKKRYPKSAAARHATGVAKVSFIIDSAGGLVYHALAHSSGEADLDAEAMAAVKSAAPYPPPPPGAPHALLATIKF